MVAGPVRTGVGGVPAAQVLVVATPAYSKDSADMASPDNAWQAPSTDTEPSGPLQSGFE